MDLQDMSLMQVYFSPDYHRAIERKQVAEQIAERSKFIVQKAKQEKKSTIIKAEAQAIATELIGKQVKTNPAYLKMKKIEIAQQIAKVIAKAKSRVYLSSDQLCMNLDDESGQK